MYYVININYDMMKIMKRQAKTVNRTFSIPENISRDLHAYVKPREMSKFVSCAIQKELNAKKEALREAYRMANEDEGQIEVTEDWESTVSDGTEEWT